MHRSVSGNIFPFRKKALSDRSPRRYFSKKQQLILGRAIREQELVRLPSVDEIREQIEDIDKQLIDLIATRMELTDELAREKKHSAKEYWDSKKEREVIDRYAELCEEVSLSEWEAKLIAEVLLKISKERQKEIYDK